MLFVFVYWFCTPWCKEIPAGQWQVPGETQGTKEAKHSGGASASAEEVL